MTEGTDKATLGTPAIPSANSTLVFRGWTLNNDAATSSEPEIKGDVEIELTNEGIYYASYSKLITVTFDPNGGTGTIDPRSNTAYFKYDQTCGTAASIEVPACTFTPPGKKKFNYWSTTSSGGAQLSVGPNSFTSDTTVYSIWKAGTYKCTYSGCNQTGLTTRHYHCSNGHVSTTLGTCSYTEITECSVMPVVESYSGYVGQYANQYSCDCCGVVLDDSRFYGAAKYTCKTSGWTDTLICCPRCEVPNHELEWGYCPGEISTKCKKSTRDYCQEE